MDVAEEKWNTKGFPMWEGWSGARKGIPVYDAWLDDYAETAMTRREAYYSRPKMLYQIKAEKI